MIYFNKELVEKAIEITKDTHDMLDAGNDLVRIDYYLNLVVYDLASLEEARKLRKELYEKYPIIGVMLTVADTFPRVKTNVVGTNYNSNKPDVICRLYQDGYGIIAHVLFKKQYIKDWKEYIVEVAD